MNSADSNLVRMSHGKAVEDANVPDIHKMSFAEVLEREYKGKSFNFSPRILSVDAISIDDLEMQLTKRRDCTMDTCIGIATHDISRPIPDGSFNYSNHRLLFVEFKLKCVSPTALNMSDLKRKASHTRSIFAGNPVDVSDIFIFPKNLIPPYKNKFNRLKRDANKNEFQYWEVMSPEDFNNYVAFEEDIPYQPINSRENIESSIKGALSGGSSDELEAILNYWRSEATRYLNCYILKEKQHIISAVTDILSEIIPTIEDEEEREYLRMEFPNFFQDQH